jgi:hypothetical protein
MRIDKNILFEKSTLKYCLSYDPLYFTNISRRRILSTDNYNFKTTSDIEIRSFSKLYTVRKFTDLYNSVDDEFKIMYDSSKQDKEITGDKTVNQLTVTI